MNNSVLKKKGVVIFIFLFFFLLCCNLLFLYFKEKYQRTQQNINQISLLKEKEEIISQMENRLFDFIKYDKYYLDSTATLFDKDNNKRDLADLKNDLPLLVLYSSGISCRTCIDDLMLLLRKENDRISETGMVVLIDSKRKAEIGVYERLIGVKSYCTSLNIPDLEMYQNYLMMLDKDFSIHFLFQTNEIDSNLTQKYLRSISKLYSRNKDDFYN